MVIYLWFFKDNNSEKNGRRKMDIEQLIDSIKKRPKMYFQEEKIEYIYYYILGYCSASHNFSDDDMDKMFCCWFWKWLVKWIIDNIDSSYQTTSVFWYEDIKKIAGEEQNEIPLFFSLCKVFFHDYKNKIGYFK